MKNFIVHTVHCLLELHALEERLSVFERNHEKVSEAKALIESVRAVLPLGVLTGHDRFRAAGKRSVAEVNHGICSGCHMAVATGLLATLQRCEGLHRCDNCGRYLYFVEEEESDRPLRRRSVRSSGVTIRG
jgi:predicted  nucleic acid-binding Zn-ribbon protein